MMRLVRRLLLTLIVPVALGAAAIFPAAASAFSRGFHVFNHSSHPIRLIGLDGNGNFSGRPPDGAVLQPGLASQDIEVTWELGDTQRDAAHYAILGDDGEPIGTFSVEMAVDGLDGTSSSACSATFGACMAFDDNDVQFYDPPHTVYDLPPTEPERQAAVLKPLCNDPSPAICTFTATSRERIISPSRQVGKALLNETGEEQSTVVTAKQTVITSDSVGVDVSVGGKLFGIVDLEIKAKYDHKWTTKHEFAQDVDVRCPAHHKCWVQEGDPMFRDHGDFDVLLGNTTWHVRDVTFDSPDPDGEGVYVVKDCELGMTGCPGEGVKMGGSPRMLTSGTYRMPARLAASPIAVPRLTLGVKGPASVTGGGHATYRIAVSRRQPAGRVAFALGRVHLTATAGHRARRWVLRTLPEDTTRTRALHVDVPRTARGRFCLVVVASGSDARRGWARVCTPVAGPPGGGGTGQPPDRRRGP